MCNGNVPCVWICVLCWGVLRDSMEMSSFFGGNNSLFIALGYDLGGKKLFMLFIWQITCFGSFFFAKKHAVWHPINVLKDEESRGGGRYGLTIYGFVSDSRASKIMKF